MGTLGAQAYQVLKADIMALTLPPGASLPESVLCERIGVSRTPIREALHRLATEGIVESVPRRGYSVSPIALRDVREIFDMRCMAEGYASRCAAQLFTPAREDELAELLETMRTFAGSTDGVDTTGYYSLTRTMDAFIVSLVPNQRQIDLLDRIWSEARRLRHVAKADPARLITSAAEHVDILAAIGSRDADLAEQTTRHHVEHSLRHILTVVNASTEITVH